MSSNHPTALEPPALIEAFLAHPPAGFEVAPWHALPAFAAPFDLLTTADDPVRRRVQGLPGYAWWRGLLTWRTQFVGATTTEYAPLVADGQAEALAQALASELGHTTRLLIVKDIPESSPLLPDAANAYADALVAALQARGFVIVEGQALAWLPIAFADEDAYLARLSRSRRKDIRRKLRSRSELAVEVVPTGAAIFQGAGTLAHFYALYEQVYAQSEIHFDKLSPEFFRTLLQDATSGGVVFLYRHGDELIGWNLCYVWHGMLVDKYIGLAYPAARETNLYFVSWMQNLEYARAHGLTHYIAGWTDPQVKASLGARFTFTRHAVRARNPLLRVLLRRLAPWFESDRAWRDSLQPAADNGARNE